MLLLRTNTSKSSLLSEQENTMFISNPLILLKYHPISTFGFARCSLCLVTLLEPICLSTVCSIWDTTQMILLSLPLISFRYTWQTPIIDYLAYLHCSPMLWWQLSFLNSKSVISRSEYMTLPLSILCWRKNLLLHKGHLSGQKFWPKRLFHLLVSF